VSVAAIRIVATILITFTVVFGGASASRSETATADDTARFLAGLRPSPNSSLAALTKDPTWISHARYFDSIFASEENTNLSKIREFSKKYLPDKHGTVLYMFSGPDFLYATSFFPTASTYVLAGLEPVGKIPELANLSPFVINGELRNLESSLGSLFNFSFFITHHRTAFGRESSEPLPRPISSQQRPSPRVFCFSLLNFPLQGRTQRALAWQGNGVNRQRKVLRMTLFHHNV
jgi:hypothetical protein